MFYASGGRIFGKMKWLSSWIKYPKQRGAKSAPRQWNRRPNGAAAFS